MQYLLMIYGDEKQWFDLPPAKAGEVQKKFSEFTESIVKSGHFRAGAQLQRVATATTVREKAGKVVTLDGPFAETKEQLGGYYLVECKDLDEALGLAKRIPFLGGAVEVRPLVPTPGGAAQK